MSFQNFFKKRKPKEEPVGPSIIGKPTNVNHDIHVIKNEKTGQLEGLPSSWLRQIGNQITQDEQNRDPDAVYLAVKYYNYSIKKKVEEEDGIKHIMTEDDIAEESKEIDDYMNSKDAHKSKDGIEDDGLEAKAVRDHLPNFSNR